MTNHLVVGWTERTLHTVPLFFPGLLYPGRFRITFDLISIQGMIRAAFRRGGGGGGGGSWGIGPPR